MLVSFNHYKPAPRSLPIATPWTNIVIEESADGQTSWVTIDTLDITPLDADPSRPASRSFSTDNATIPNGWYRISFVDAEGNRDYTEPIEYAPTEILASLDDINGNLDSNIVRADLNNSGLIQNSVARIIRANLGQIIPVNVLFSWNTPSTTPEIIREAAAKMIAGQLYIQEVSRSGQLIPEDHYGMMTYRAGLDLLKQVISGEILIPNIVETPTGELTVNDFFPIDDTDRAFTMSMEL